MDEQGTQDSRDDLDVTRDVIIHGKTFRLQLHNDGDDNVAVDLTIEGDDGEQRGHFSGRFPVTDLLATSRAVASLLGGAAVTLGQAAATVRADLEELRRHHPNAYAPWSAAEEARLAEHYRSGRSIDELAQEFGRRPGAIERRLLRVLPPSAGQPETDNQADDESDDEEPDWL